MVVVLVFLVHQYDIVNAVDTTFECSMLHPSTPSTPGGCVLAFRCTVPQDPLTALRALATLAVFATAISRNLLYARLWWGRLPPPRHDLFGWWFTPESSERAKMAQSVRQLRRDEARINFPPILHNDALVQLPHVWAAYFNLFVDPNNRMAHAIKSAVQVRRVAPAPPPPSPLVPAPRLLQHSRGRKPLATCCFTVRVSPPRHAPAPARHQAVEALPVLPDTDIVVMDADEEYAERAVDRRSFVAGQAIVYSTWRMCFADPVIGFLTPAITGADISAAARYGVRRPYAAVPDMLYQRYSLRAEMACGLLIQSYQQLAASEGTNHRTPRAHRVTACSL